LALSACGTAKPMHKDAYRVQVTYILLGYARNSGTVNFDPDGKDVSVDRFFGRSGGSPAGEGRDSFHTIWIQPDPRSYDQIRGTALFHNVRLNLSFGLAEKSDGEYVVDFSGPMDYMNTQEIRNCVGVQCIGGNIAKHLDVHGSVHLTPDVPARYDLPNGLKLVIVLEPESRFITPQAHWTAAPTGLLVYVLR
jgi:hypothetical protein